MVAGRRGMFQWRLEARGQGAHSGLHYWEGRSALVAAARWVTEAEALSRPDGGPTVNAGRFVAGDATFVDGLATAHHLLGTDRQLNVVPDRAVVEGEARFLRAAERDDLARRLEALARDVAVATGTEISLRRQPARSRRSIPTVPTPAPASRAVASPPPPAGAWRSKTERGGISFPNFLPDPGRIPVLDGLGPDRRRDAHAGGVRGAALATAADRAAGGPDGGGWPERLNRVTLSLKEGREP